MNRKSFLKLFGIGAITAVVVPSLVILKPKSQSSRTEGVIPYMRRIANMKPSKTPLDIILEQIDPNGILRNQV